MTYVRPNIDAMAGYEYGEQPDDPSAIKLNTNENPYPPSPLVRKALATFDPSLLRKYPNATASECRRVLARKFGLQPDQFLITNGGDEAIRLVVTTFLDPGDMLATTNPGYSLYPVVAKVQDCPVLDVPIPLEGYRAQDILDSFNTEQPKLLCLVNPHAPTGFLLGVEELSTLARNMEGLLLIDEAYVDFVSSEVNHNAVALLDEFDNVLILRTLSKGYSLAGLRFGWLMANRALIEPIATKTRDSYNIDALAQSLGTAALLDDDHATCNQQKVIDERVRLASELRRFKFEVMPSQTNFLLARLSDNQLASSIFDELRSRNIFVRYFNCIPLDDCLRITVGTAEQNDSLLRNLETILNS